tara:strand:+ start:1245 stop:1952 length:708 start_codon:yes stop_codon:yes gene_type:complete
MNKVLILGNGLLGTEIQKQSKWDIISRDNNGFDITDLDTFHKMTKTIFGAIQSCPYNIIINCIANTDTYSKDKQSHWDTNYKGTSNLINFCNKWKIKLVHISTDYVYANSDQSASETTVPVHCNNWYSYTKLLADGLVELQSNDYLICRCTHKPKPFPHSTAWIDQIGNFDYVDTIAGLIIKLIENESIGIYNVGTEMKSMYELAIKTNSVITGNKPNQVPNDTTMNIDKIKRIL